RRPPAAAGEAECIPLPGHPWRRPCSTYASAEARSRADARVQWRPQPPLRWPRRGCCLRRSHLTQQRHTQVHLSDEDPMRLIWRYAVAAMALTALAGGPALADIAVYGDALAAGWQDWSWGGVTRDFARTTPVHAGSAAIAVTYT